MIGRISILDLRNKCMIPFVLVETHHIVHKIIVEVNTLVIACLASILQRNDNQGYP